MITQMHTIPVDDKHLRSDPVVGMEERGLVAIQDRSEPLEWTRTLASRAQRALRWAGICLIVEAAVITILAGIGLLIGMTAGHHLFWALGVGFCLATPPCIVAAVVTAEIIEDQSHDSEL